MAIGFQNALEVLVDVPLIDPGVGIQADSHQLPTRSQDAYSLSEKCDLVPKMMKSIDAEDAVKRLTCPRQTFSGPLHENGSGRLDSCTRQHPSRGVHTRDASLAAVQRSKPMAGTSANFEYVLVGMLTDEDHQRRQDAGVIVLLISPVVRLGDVVVVYVSSHRVLSSLRSS